MENSKGKGTLLRNALKANSAFSAISGLMLFAGHSFIAKTIGLSNPVILIVIGLSLMVFSWILFQLASKQEMKKQVVWTIVGSDFAWVLSSAVLLIMFPHILNETGRLIVILIALVVFILAELQAWGQWQLGKFAHDAK
ncbi:MAG: hypothetical protein ACQ9MH_10825 [Nitrospinales bacterium]